MEEFVKKIQIGEKFKVKFVSMTHDGKGVCKINGMLKNDSLAENFPIFVNNAISNEEGIIEITSLKKTLGNGKIIKLFKDKTSKYRVEPMCPIYENCGGCHLMHLSYEGQLAFKKSMVKQTMEKIGGFKDLKIKNVIGSVNQDKYRNKVQVPVGCSYNGQVIAGFYKKGTHTIIDMDKCYIEDPEADKILVTIKKLLTKFEIEPADIMKDTGIVRYILIRRSKKNGNIMVVFITKNDFFPKKERIVKELVERHKDITTIVQNINNKRTSMALGKKDKILYGPGYIEDEIDGLKFKISAQSFYQVNPTQTEVLYSKAIEYASLKEGDLVLDAYCGVGTIGLCVAKKASKVLGVEIVKDAIEDAKQNALINGIDNIEFICADAKEFIRNSDLNFDVIFVDPPRKGCDKEFLETIMNANIKRIVYVSCDPKSLVRDLDVLRSKYDIKKVSLVDMFGNTTHVETVVSLELNLY